MENEAMETLFKKINDLEALEPDVKRRVANLTCNFIDSLYRNGLFLAGPVPAPTSTSQTHATIECPKCRYRISGDFT